MDTNIVVVKGTLVRPFDIAQLNNEAKTVVARGCIAVNKNRKGEDGRYLSNFFNVTFFGKTAENVTKFFDKGSKIIVTGKLDQDSYVNKDGQKVNTVTIIGDGFDFADSKNKESKSESEVPTAVPAGDPLEEEMPF